MYTTRKSEIAKLREYLRELNGVYAEVVARRDLPRARQVYDLRRRVRRSVLIREEWHVDQVLPASEAIPADL